MKKLVKLNGVTKRGKTKVREHGEEWLVVGSRDKVLFNTVNRNWLDLESTLTGNRRWVHPTADIDFVVS